MKKREYTTRLPVAIMVDGAFLLKQYVRFFPKDDDNLDRNISNHNPKTVADNIYKMLHRHVEGALLYRIFFYDCLPITGKSHNPISKKAIDFEKTPQYAFRLALHDELKKKRKVAIRLGYIKNFNNWQLSKQATKDILSGKRQVSALNEWEISLQLKQTGVDMKIGLDIASLAYKRLVDRIILVTGDSDFVPAAKLARREGIDFILDPMRKRVSDDLHEHIDGIRSYVKHQKKKLN